jgi:hypothetical protein
MPSRAACHAMQRLSTTSSAPSSSPEGCGNAGRSWAPQWSARSAGTAPSGPCAVERTAGAGEGIDGAGGCRAGPLLGPRGPSVRTEAGCRARSPACLDPRRRGDPPQPGDAHDGIRTSPQTRDGLPRVAVPLADDGDVLACCAAVVLYAEPDVAPAGQLGLGQLDRPSVFVTAKGGCGKTTVAAALGMAAAASGGRSCASSRAGACSRAGSGSPPGAAARSASSPASGPSRSIRTTRSWGGCGPSPGTRPPPVSCRIRPDVGPWCRRRG